MTEFELYFSQLYDGRIVASEKNKRWAEHLLEAAAQPGKYHFDYEIGNEPVQFIEKFCKLPTGKIGTPFQLELFQKARIQAVFGFVDDHLTRQYNEAFTFEGRKNGKTSEGAGINLYMVSADGEGAPQNYNVATKYDQATLGYNAAARILRQSAELKKYIRKRTADLYCDFNMGYIKALASDTKSLDGLDIHFANIDELEAIKKRDLYDLIKQGTGSRRQPLIWITSTNGFLRDNILDAQYDYAVGVIEGKIKDEHFCPFLYELDSIDEWDKEECWIKANPGLGTIKSWDYMRQMVFKAKNDPSFKPTVLVKDFNLKQNNSSAFFAYEGIDNSETSEESFKYCIGGFDAADKIDLNAAVAICQKPGYDKLVVRSMFWLPEAQLTSKDGRTERDYVPYQDWASQGLLRIVPGNKVDKQVILDWYLELRDEQDLFPLFIGYDPWHISDELLYKFKMEFGASTMIPVRQGSFSLSDPMKDLKAEFRSQKIIYQNNPILKWNLMNLAAKRDVNNNIQPIKNDSPLKRIDGAVALIIAYKILGDKLEEYLDLNEE